MQINLAATFGWLCVETAKTKEEAVTYRQPPSGGCVLKHQTRIGRNDVGEQPPSGGCVLKHI